MTHYAHSPLPHPKKILDQLGYTPLHQLGQNFLQDPALLQSIIAYANLDSEQAIVEIGGGTGALTQYLSQEPLPMMCVELDKGLHAWLDKNFSSDKTQIFHGDVLAKKNQLLPELLEFMNEQNQKGLEVVFVANLPYAICTPLLFNLMLHHSLWRKGVFTVQTEFAQRLTAEAGNSNYCPLAVFTALGYDVKILKKIPAKMFWPKPEVESSLIHIEKINPEKLDLAFSERLKWFFSQRRKTLRSKLKKEHPEYNSQAFFQKENLSESIRVEQIHPEILWKLHQELKQ